MSGRRHYGPAGERRRDEVGVFVEALAPLARHVEIVSSDDSLAVPAPPRPQLLVTVTWHSSTHAGLRWEWSYGEVRCDLSAPDPLELEDARLGSARTPTTPR